MPITVAVFPADTPGDHPGLTILPGCATASHFQAARAAYTVCRLTRYSLARAVLDSPAATR